MIQSREPDLTYEDYEAMLPREEGERRWTMSRVELRFNAACSTLRRIPAADARVMSQSLTARYPDAPVQWIEYGSVKASSRPPMPSARAISQLDQVLDWYCRWLGPSGRPPDLPMDVGQILWARAAGMSWKKITKLRSARSRSETLGNGPRAVKRYHAVALHWLAERLNLAGVEVRDPA